MRRTKLDASMDSLFSKRKLDERRRQVVAGFLDSAKSCTCASNSMPGAQGKPTSKAPESGSITVVEDKPTNPAVALATIWADTTNVLVFWLPMFFTKKLLDALAVFASFVGYTLNAIPPRRKQS